MGGTQTQFDPTAPYAPASASAGSFDPTASYSPATAKPNTLGDMADVALQGLKGIAQISAPGIAASLINKTAPALAAKLQQVPYIGPMMRQAAPLNQIPGMATVAMASPLAEGMATGDLVPDPNAPRPQPAPSSPASPNGSSLLKIMSRHIPVIGRGLRAMDTVGQLQDLANGPAPPPPTPAPTQIPQTNGIPWGSGGQGPLALRGQMIPRSAVYPGAPLPENPGTFPGAPYPETPSSEVLQGNALSRGAQSGQPLPGAALGQIPQAQIAPQAQPSPQTPNVQAQPVQPVPQVSEARPAAMLQFDPVANSSQLAGHAYDPQTQTATIQFKNGQVHQYYGVTPEQWAQYSNSSSPGQGFNQFIKKDPATGAGRMSRPLTANSAKSPVQAQPTTANELLERYIGIF